MALADHVQVVGVLGQLAAQPQVAQHHVDRGVRPHGHHVRVHQAPGAVLVVGQHLLEALAVLAVHRLQDFVDHRVGQVLDQVGEVVDVEVPRPPRPARPGPCPRSATRAPRRRRAPAPRRRPGSTRPQTTERLPGGSDSSRLPISAGDRVLTSRRTGPSRPESSASLSSRNWRAVLSWRMASAMGTLPGRASCRAARLQGDVDAAPCRHGRIKCS